MFYKIIIDNYISIVGEGSYGEEITEAEYNTILNLIHNKPTAPEGYDYRLKDDTLEWELYELPEPIEEEATIEDYEAALAELGVK